MNDEQTFLPFYMPEPTRLHRARTSFVCEDALEILDPPRARGPLINRPELVCEYLAEVAQWRPSVEKFWVCPVDRKNRALGRHLLSVGTATSTLAHPREVFRVAIAAAAAGVIVAHNHPSGDPAPSAADVQLTRQLREAARAVDIDLIDHVILGRADCDPHGVGFYSFRQAGVI